MSDDSLLLGAETAYPSCYSPQLLFPIPRVAGREAIGVDSSAPFYGYDLWTAYELSWLNKKGKPQVAIADISMPCHTENLVESKSLKLYLNSLNQVAFSSPLEVATVMERDLSSCVNGPVSVDIHTLDRVRHQSLSSFPGHCIDDLDVDVESYEPEPSLLGLVNESRTVTESYYSHLLKTNCPVTGQPDWASVFIRYTGWPMDPEGLLKYIISYRNHQDFHEQCIERIFTEIKELCQPDALEVYGRYTRRGGLDINPYRSSSDLKPPLLRLSRQ